MTLSCTVHNNGKRLVANHAKSHSLLLTVTTVLTYLLDLLLTLRQREEQIFINSKQQQTSLASVVEVRYMCV